MFGSLLRLFRREPRQQQPVEREPNAGKQQLRLGLALSSGGARGLAHVGVLQVLEENGIEVHAIAGSSMGGYIGALWAAGFSGKKLEELAAEMQDRRTIWKLADPIIPPVKGLFRGLKAKAHLEKSLGDLRFEDLKRQLLLVTVDIDTKERVILREGKLSDAVHASCAMPGIIAPVLLNGRYCVDGGVVDPVPVGVLRKYSDVDKVIAVSVVPTFEQIEGGGARPPRKAEGNIARRFFRGLNSHVNLLAPGNALDIFRQSIRAAQIRIAHDSVKGADLCLRPEHFFSPWHNYSEYGRFIEAGRKVALEHLDEIRALVRADSETHDHEKPGNNMVGELVA